VVRLNVDGTTKYERTSWVGGYTMAYLAPRRQMLRRVVRTGPELFAPVGPVRALARPCRPLWPLR
jgi:hypothetical protein